MNAMTVFRCVLLALILGVALIPMRAADARDCAGDSLPPLELSANEEGIAVAGGTPLGRILLVGYERELDLAQAVHRLRRRVALASANANGELSIEQSAGPGATWAAIDIASGRCGTAMGDTAALEEIHRDALKVKNGKLANVEVRFPFAYMLLVRPGTGVWELTAGDGGVGDDDGDGERKPNGKTVLSLAKMEVLEASEPVPDELEAGDVVMVFSPGRRVIASTRVKGGR